jgi:hypothetical protein
MLEMDTNVHEKNPRLVSVGGFTVEQTARYF